MTEEEMQERNDFINGIRALADYVEQHDDLPTPSISSWEDVTVSCYVSRDHYDLNARAWINDFEEAARNEISAELGVESSDTAEFTDEIQARIKARAEELYREAQVRRFSEVNRAMIHAFQPSVAVPAETAHECGIVPPSTVTAIGQFEKKSDDYAIKAVRKFSSNVKLTCSLAHETATCEQVVTGTRTVKEPDPDLVKQLRDELTERINALPKIEQIREDKKWVCPPSLLAMPTDH